MILDQLRRTNVIFTECHDSLIHLERAFHNIGVAIRLFEAVNDRFEKTVLIFNTKTKKPIKSVLMEGKTAFQAIQDIIQAIPEEYGYESSTAFPQALREFVREEMQKKNITATNIAKESGDSLSMVSYTLSGNRRSTHVMETAADMLGYESLDAMIAASRGRETA